MTETEKMEAIKRSYAEMILNTAKEAAARVMKAELRARRMEQGLVSTKKEAAGMLLRLKQMNDAKNKEAEILSFNQQRKFDELEAQLNEAEGIILDLRAELNQAQEQLEEVKNRKMSTNRRSVEELSTCNGYENFTKSGPEFGSVGGSNLFFDCSTLDKRYSSPAKQSVTSNPECEVYSDGDNPVSDQIKEPEWFRNGCTERICVSEMGLLQESFPDGKKSSTSKNSISVGVVNAIKSTSALEEKFQHGESNAVSTIRRSLRKRKLKFWDDIITACGLKGSYQFKKPRKAFRHHSCFSTRKMKRSAKYGEYKAEDGTKIESLNRAEAPFPKELLPTEGLPENMELTDVLVRQDEVAATSELASSSRIDCDVEAGTAIKASNPTNANGKRLCKYRFNRKWKKKFMIYPEKSS